MTRELIIAGEHMDLAPDTEITLEYVSNAVGDLGKINLSHSYTIKLPKSAKNSKVLDAPGIPGHASERTRRFLPARFFQNGIDLIGPAQAYILQTTPEAYEIALVWNTLESLQALSENSATINELPNLPVLPWITQGALPDYLDSSGSEAATGAFFATYDSGLGAYAFAPTQIKTAPHPCMRVSNLMERILENAGVPYTVSDKAQEAIGRKVVLAAPGHKPNRGMEYASGNVAAVVRLHEGLLNNTAVQFFNIGQWETGWDSLKVYGSLPESAAGTSTGAVLGPNKAGQLHVLLNWRMPSAFADSSIIVEGLQYSADMNAVINRETLLQVFTKTDDDGCYVFADEDISFNNWTACGIRLEYAGSALITETLSAYNAGLPLAAINHVHETIDVTKDNRFPLEGNLPDIKQWEFIKATMAFCGLAPIIQNDALNFYTYAEILDRTDAYDWTSKVDMTDGGPETLKYSLNGWAQKNEITFKDNNQLSADPTARMIVEDSTITESRKWFELPWAASKQSSAVHYKVTEAEDGAYEVEDIDIEPRIFDVDLTRLFFRDSMKGAGLIETRYNSLQKIVRTPVALTANIRLHEVDIAKLDLTRPVYLGQFGQYYGILKIQTGTDMCKVELIQLS